MEEWLLFMNGMEIGPYTADEIREMIAGGKIHVKILTRRVSSPNWITIDKDPVLAKLFPHDTMCGSERSLPVAEVRYDANADVLRLTCPKCHQAFKISKSVKSGTRLQCQVCLIYFTLHNPLEQGSDTPLYSPIPKQPSPEEIPVPPPPENNIPEEPPAQSVPPPEGNIPEEKTPAPGTPPPPQKQEPEEEVRKNENVDFSEKQIEGNITCPHCWKTFSAGDILYISNHPDLHGDDLLGPDAQRRFIPTVYNSQGIPLDAKDMPCTDLACPHCHLQIPSSILDEDSEYFSIVGAPSSGKSYYLTALVHMLRKDMPEFADCSFSDVDPRLNRTLNVYENLVFMAIDKSKVVSLLKTEEEGMDFSDQTMMNDLAINLPKPFIFETTPLTNEKTSFERTRHNIIFYDNAGEHFEPGRERVSNPATQHLAHSHAIFFIFDPLNDAEMRRICDHADPQMQDTSKISNQTVLFAEMISRIRRHSNMTASQKSSIPLVLAVAKYDAWEKHFPDVRNISPFSFNPETLEMDFDSNVVYSISFALRELMMQYAPGIVAQAESFFESVFFLPVSSFGTLAEVVNPEVPASERQAIGILPEKLAPVWVDVPFFTVMDHYGLLRRKNGNKPEGIQLQVRRVDDKIVFAHPQTMRRVQLPLNYAGHTIRIGEKNYLLPQLPGGQDKQNSKKDYFG